MWAALLVGLSSCSLQDYLAPYEGVNLLESIPFSEWAADDGTGTYMRWEEEPTVQYEGENAYRLRTCNLLSNGDFEDVPSGVSPWSNGGSVGLTREDTTPLNGTGSLKVDISDPSTDYAYIDATAVLSDAFAEGSYLLRFLYQVPGSNFPVEYNDTVDSPRRFTTFVSSSGITNSFPDAGDPDNQDNLFQRDPSFTSHRILIGSLSQNSNAATILIDDFKILRFDDPPIRARLSLRASGDTPLDLVSGTYRLSFMVRQDPEAGTDNVFPASRIAVRINTLYDPQTGTFIDNGYIHAVPAEPSWDTGWVEVSVEEHLTISPTDPDDPVLQICISASDPSSPLTMDAGSILVARPRLELVRD
ncbi:hypothetical protein Spith_0084 [Spirochaeta thermophila DSM 6578]|uniref:Uncharacterized protein n=2 Tax=Winmispira thermophila TaxID=154 RepID=G0GBL2_WINT7|nr:hypothetical protein Spith_0084 [Spirochaeta thermophila DSM 6578]